jgi:hypothetical protein
MGRSGARGVGRSPSPNEEFARQHVIAAAEVVQAIADGAALRRALDLCRVVAVLTMAGSAGELPWRTT